ncbi:AI-2E family transporter YdiK [Bdellovibrio sp. KM01]|uniref:AI-2E family transporter YdiK n=1 Tax=Bdellovibrio sp. KM01 TaxID=2748865 RepID=UPI0015E90B51|nr:AI-2E family transporter YdiK [Bdellovibrio sp. KM01]QLY27120.1 AI-2E family transporter YdiK [Bdellovibrio sp. KM01]
MQTSTPITKTLLTSIVILSLGLVSLWVLSPFIPSLFWAAMITITTWPLLEKLTRRMGGRRGLAITIMMIAMAALVIAPIGAGAYILFTHVDDGIAWLRELPNKQLPPLPEFVTTMPLVGPKISEKWAEFGAKDPTYITEQVRAFSLSAMNYMATAAKEASLFFVYLLLTLGLTGFLYATGETAANGIRKFFIRLAGERGDHAVILAAQSVKAVAMGIVITAAIQTALAGIGLFLTDVPLPGVLTAVAFILCIAQIGVIIPMLIAVGWLYFKDQTVVATSLLVWALFVTAIDNFIRPVLIHKGADLPMILILAGVIGGLLSFGPIGLFIGPVILAVTYRLLESWVTEQRIELELVANIKPLPHAIRPKVTPPSKEKPLDH